jgi:hypothetical protein
MKSTILWDYEPSVGLSTNGLSETGWVPYLYKAWGDIRISGDRSLASYWSNYPGLTAENIGQVFYNTDGSVTGYVFRKFVRNYAGQSRSDGNFNWPVIRLADVYLMYAEAVNEVNNGPDDLAIQLVNKIRGRGNLPDLGTSKTANKSVFFDAIEQERIVELIAEGHRGFDLRRWRAIERVWGPPLGEGIQLYDTGGAPHDAKRFQNLSALDYQRCYIFKIPQSERDRNPNLTQNPCWL